MLYTILKHSHMTLALISIFGFLLRAYFSFYRPELLKVKVIKIAPHIIDTLLLIMAISLIILMGYGFQGWIIAKVIALFFYIGFSVIVIKSIGTIWVRVMALTASILSFSYIVSVAITKQAFWFF